MEWLGHSIHSAISMNQWKPIKLSRSGPHVFHLFFADNLVIFSRVDLDHSKVLKDILDRFCSFSGHWINAGKTNIFFSKGVEDFQISYSLREWRTLLLT